MSFSPYTRKTGTQKTGRSFQRCPRRERYSFVASRRAGPTRTKILKRHNTTTNSRFMIDLVAEMPFEKTAWCFCPARMACKEWPLGCRDVGIVGSIGQPMGDYGLGYIGIDHYVGTRCQRVGRPTTTCHDRGHYCRGNVSSDAWEADSWGPHN